MIQKSTRGVQQHEVNAVADALLAEQQRPTVERVRGKLGRGSPNTVGPMLETWFAGLAARLGVLPDNAGEGRELPPAPLRQAFQELWTQAVGTARAQSADEEQARQAQLAQDRDHLEIAREELQRQETALAERSATLEQALELARNQLKDQAAQLDDASKQLVQARTSLARLVEERDADRRRFDSQAEAASQERERLQAREQANERRLLEEVDRARQDAKQLRGELVEAARRHETVLADAQRRLQVATDSQAQGMQEIAALRERIAAAELRTLGLQEQLAAARTVVPAVKTSRKPVTARRKPVRG